MLELGGSVSEFPGGASAKHDSGLFGGFPRLDGDLEMNLSSVDFVLANAAICHGPGIPVATGDRTANHRTVEHENDVAGAIRKVHKHAPAAGHRGPFYTFWPHPSSSRSDSSVSKRLLTTRQVAEFLGVSPETVLRRWRAGELPGETFGDVPLADLQRQALEIAAWRAAPPGVCATRLRRRSGRRSPLRLRGS